jgi:thiamine kinase-like enzyme
MFVYKEFIKANFEKYKELYEVKSNVTGAEADIYLKDKTLNDLINICNYILGNQTKFHHLDDSFEARKERNDRAKMIIGKIEHRGLFSKESVVALRKALTILHNNGIYHGDLHFRNLIVEANTGKLFMIDFGSALMVKGLDQANHIAGDEGVNDEAMVIYLDRLSKTPGDFVKDRIDLDLGRAKRIQEIALASQSKEKKKMTAKEIKIVGAWEKLKKRITEEEPFEKAVKNFGYDLGGFGDGEELFNAQIAGLLLLVDAGYAGGVRDYCKKVIGEPKSSQAFKNKLNLLLEYLA